MHDIFSSHSDVATNTTTKEALDSRQALSSRQALEFVAHIPQNLTKLIALAGLANAPSKPFTCGIINAKSGRCGEDCAFCAQSRCHNTGTPVYDLVSEESLYEHACLLAERRVDRMGIVTSGGAPSKRDLEKLTRVATRIVKGTGIELCASFGMITSEQATCLVEAGFTRYHHNLETARSFYPSICTTHSYDIREKTVRVAQAAGLRVCSGGLFGMGETWAQRIELSEIIQDLNVDSIPINFLIPIAGTRMEHYPSMQVTDALALIAIMRLMHPQRDIVLCGGREKCLGEWDRSFFFAGANGLMVGDYLTAKGSSFERDVEMLEALGLRHA